MVPIGCLYFGVIDNDVNVEISFVFRRLRDEKVPNKKGNIEPNSSVLSSKSGNRNAKKYDLFLN